MKDKVLVVYPNKSTFIEKDIEILSLKWSLTEYHFKNSKGCGIFFQFLNQFFFLVKKIREVKFVYICFAHYHSVLPVMFCKLFSRKVFIMVGGSEAHCFPEFNYGNHTRFLPSIATCFSLKYCSIIFPKHCTLIKSDYNYSSVKYTKQGYVSICKNENLEGKSITIENGYESSIWHSKAVKEKYITTVGNDFHNTREFVRKGLDIILHIAPFFEDYKFIIIGGGNLPKELISKNVLILPYLSKKEVFEWLSKTQIYLQLSMAEGFPNALCEAMLCECVPIGSNVFGIPDIIGNADLILKIKDKHEAIAILKNVLDSDMKVLGEKSRKRIEELYNISRRKKLLTEAIENNLA